jgi:DNA-binding response OmpR family regulator
LNKKVLVVDDERKIVDLIRAYLEKQDYEVIAAFDGERAIEMARREKPDLIVLDLNLPAVDGLDVFRSVRTHSNIPIIMLTARGDDVDKLVGLEMGADDYVTKPFSPRELVARVKAVLRRAGGEAPQGEEIKFDEVSIDLRSHLVRKNGDEVTVTPTEFRLLEIFARNPGRVFSRSELLDLAQGYNFEGFERTIDVHIKNLRQKLEDNPREPKYIVTVYGIGYRFEVPQNA